MGHYAVLYGKLGAIRREFLSSKDLSSLEDQEEYEQAIRYLDSRGLLPKEGEKDLSPRSIERTLRERFLVKINSFRFYLPDPEQSIFKFFLYKYDIYNLKILLALHFSHHDRSVSEFVYRNTPLFRRYAFLIERESFLDKDLLLAFQGTAIFPFLMHTYRNYKQKGDLFFLDTVLEDEYYQHMLKFLDTMRDGKLKNVLVRVLLIHNIIWGMRMHFIYSMSKEEIFYYLVLPLPNFSSSEILGLFSVKRVSEFRDRLQRFLTKSAGLSQEIDLPLDLVGIKNKLQTILISDLERYSYSSDVQSLSGVVAWIFAQEMLLDRLRQILYRLFLNQMKGEDYYAQSISS